MLSRYGQKNPEDPLKVKDGLLKTFECIYTKKTKHRKKCSSCGKLIQDGEKVVAEQIKSEKYYPVKGLMYFVTWRFWHSTCVIEDNARDIERKKKYAAELEELKELSRNLSRDK